jgi:hypothetical protein
MRNAALLLVTVFASMATVADAQVICLDGRCDARGPVARALRPAPTQSVVVVNAQPVESVPVVVSQPAAPVVVRERVVVRRPVVASHTCDGQPVAAAPRCSCCSSSSASRGGAQAHADACAASGRFVHASDFGGGYEGIGWSSVSADHAVRSCCYWGRRPVREISTAYCPIRRQWFAVVRYR